jgi:LITAF-like zinc ribbon domain
MNKGREIPFKPVSDQDTSMTAFTERDLPIGVLPNQSATHGMEITHQNLPYESYPAYHETQNYPHHQLQRHYQNHTQNASYAAPIHPEHIHSHLVPRYNNSVYSVPSVYQPQPDSHQQTGQMFGYNISGPQRIEQQVAAHQGPSVSQEMTYSPYMHTAYHGVAMESLPPTPQPTGAMSGQQLSQGQTFEAFLDPQPIVAPGPSPLQVFCPHCKQQCTTVVKSGPMILPIILLVLCLGPIVGAILTLILYKIGVLVQHVHKCNKCAQRLSRKCAIKSKQARPSVRLAVAGWAN